MNRQSETRQEDGWPFPQRLVLPSFDGQIEAVLSSVLQVKRSRPRDLGLGTNARSNKLDPKILPTLFRLCWFFFSLFPYFSKSCEGKKIEFPRQRKGRRV